MVRIQDFEGSQYSREGTPSEMKDYAFFNQQYATSSYQVEHKMYPDLIVQPKGDKDLMAAVQWAKVNKVAVAVKSGGHQYSGASSTNGKNIQIDLSQTYKDLRVLPDPKAPYQGQTWIYVGVSNRLRDFHAYLQHQGFFVPHGQCAYVGIGGHAQTGGYGQLGRSFGLLGDHIRGIRLVTADATIKEVTKESDADLFYAILGGSPGNFGIITHYTLEVHRDEDYTGTSTGSEYGGPRGIKGLWVYSQSMLKTLLSSIAKMADDPNVPRNFDLCVSVLSTDFPMATLFPELKRTNEWDKVWDKIKKFVADETLKLLNGKFPASIVLYAQWCPVNKDDKYDSKVDAWFQQFRDLNKTLEYGALQVNEFKEPMSILTGRWIFPNEREFNLPYVKRTYGTKSTSLTKDKWVDTVTDRIDLIYNPRMVLDGQPGDDRYERYQSCKLSAQIQCFGGPKSRFTTNADNGTSYSWRDSTVLQTLDCFHNPDDAAKKLAIKWQEKNDTLMSGPSSSFSKQDRRYLWGSYGEWDMSKSWPFYYEDEAKYKKIGKVRARADPNGTFTPNPFAVEVVKTVTNGTSK